MSLTIVQITDTHIPDQAQAEFKGIRTDIFLQRIIQQIKFRQTKIDLVVATGDLTHDGTQAACQTLQTLFDHFDCPVYVTPGNHDSQSAFENFLINSHISMPQAIQLDHWDLLFADSHIEGQAGGQVDKDRLRQLDQQLQSTSRNSILFTHHPPVTINSAWMDQIGMHNGEELLSTLASHRHLKAIFFGHIHQQFHQQSGHIELYGSPSTCVQFLPGSDDFALDSRAPAYRFIQLGEHGELATHVVRCNMQIEKIISGGQTGVDRAALDTAQQLAIPTGGWCPSGRRALDGTIAQHYPLMETPSADYPQRTEWNVRDADGSLILCRGKLSGGTALTLQFAQQYQRPSCIIDLQKPSATEDFWQWLEQQQIKILNIAGPRESDNAPIYTDAQHCLLQLLTQNT